MRSIRVAAPQARRGLGERLFFIGDYIDYGPSSKKVIDLLVDLPFDKVFLRGNHDDLLLQFVKRSDLFEEHGNVWFRGSGRLLASTAP